MNSWTNRGPADPSDRGEEGSRFAIGLVGDCHLQDERFGWMIHRSYFWNIAAISFDIA